MADTPSAPAKSSYAAKGFAVIALLLVIALASIIAGLPMPYPSNQDGLSVVNSDSGYNAWLIVATILSFFLSPALVYLYSLLHGFDGQEILHTVLVTGSLVTFLWVLFTFSLTYGKDAKGNGVMGYPLTYYMFKDTWAVNDASLNDADNLSNAIFAVYELGFALLTPAIIAASLAGRVNLNSFLLFVFIWHITVYCPVAHTMWSARGALYTNRIRDFSGGLIVHTLAGISAIAVHLVLGKDSVPKTSTINAKPHKVLFHTLLVWFLWFGFNAGKAHAADPVASQSIVNTIAASMSSLLISFLYHLVMERAFTPVSIANAVLIGLIAITPASGYVAVGGAMVIAVFVCLFVLVFTQFVCGEGCGINESFKILTAHLLAGILGFLWTAILSYDYVNSYGYSGLTSGYGMPLAYQISGLLAVAVIAFIATYIIAFVVNIIAPLKAQNEEIEYRESQVDEAAAPKQETQPEPQETA